MDQLIEFLRAQLDEEEDIALDAANPVGSEHWRATWIIYEGIQLWDGSDPDWVGFPTAAARHISLHDPARALREILAKRRIIDSYIEAQQELIRHMQAGEPTQARFGALEALEKAVKFLAASYSDHPHYPNEEEQQYA